jgi:hypothetical protein
MHRRENPLCDLEGPRAGCSRDSASVQADRERSRAKPDRSSLRVSPIPMRPEGASGSKRCVNGADAQALSGESASAQKDLRKQRVGVFKRTHQAMRWLTIRLRRRQHPRQVVAGAAVGDLDHFGDTAHPTQSGLERDNTVVDRKSRIAAPPCRAWPASRGARSHRARFSWTTHSQGQHGNAADICPAQYPRSDSASTRGPAFKRGPAEVFTHTQGVVVQ